MAEGGEISDTFKLFATKADKQEATTKDITRWMTDAGAFGKQCCSNNLDIAFSKVKPKGKTTITMTELQPLIDELAKAYKVDKKLDNVDAAKTQLKEKLMGTKPKKHGTTSKSKTGGVGRMTDAKNYTGSHKERFDKDGKGKGKEGREDVTDDSGFVGNYKGQDSYDKK